MNKVPITTYYSVSLEDLQKEMERLNKIPTMNDLLRENKQLKQQNEFLMKKDNVLQSLKQWLRYNIEHIECTDWSEDYLSGLSEVLSKIEELEGE